MEWQRQEGGGMENENFNTGGTGATLFAGKGNPTTNGQVRDGRTQYMFRDGFVLV